MTVVMVTREKNWRKTRVSSKTDKLTVFKNLEGEMDIYIKVIKCKENYLEGCGFFMDKYGYVLAKLEETGFTYSKQNTI